MRAMSVKAVASVAALVAGTAGADPAFPRIYDLAPEARADGVEIHAEPGATAAVIGHLDGNAPGVEVIAVTETGDWLQVPLAERTGWARTGQLRPRPASEYGKAGDRLLFAPNMRCSGTEPFWSLDVTQMQDARLSRMGEDDLTLPAGRIRVSAKETDRYFLDLGPVHAALLEAEICSDGMSDRLYGLQINLVVDQSDIVRGCCSLVP